MRTLASLWIAAALAACGGSSSASTTTSTGTSGASTGTTSSGGSTSGTTGSTQVPLTDGGLWLSVWAPNASAVSAVGDFGTAPLALADGGIWIGFAAGAGPGQHYQFSIENNGATLTRTDPAAPLVGADPGKQEPPGIFYDQSEYQWTSGLFTPPTARHAVVYELHVATFNDPTGTGAGTYQSAAAKLADLAQLGVNLIELMPVAEFPGNYSWGYNPVYPFAPCRAYGTPDDLKALIDQAHQLGLGVILDVVFNHFGLDSLQTPSLSMWCFDGPCLDGGIYFAGEPATPYGPRPAFGVTGVNDLILSALSSWVTNYRVDGFRWDSVVNIRTTGNTSQLIPAGAELLKQANLALHADAGLLSIAEDLQGWATITAPADPATVNQYDSGYGFDGQWDDSFFYAVKPLLISNSDSARDVTTLVGPLTNGPPMTRVVFTEDHDQVAPQNGANNLRIPALIGLSDNAFYAEKRSGLGLSLVLTAPGIPMLFMGQEFLETLPFPFSAGQAIDWTNETTYAGFRQMVHDLIALRENTAGETRGLTGDNTAILEAANTHGDGGVSPAIAYHRWVHGGPGDDVVIAASFCNQQLALPIGLPAAGAWHVRFNSDDTAYSPNFGGTSSADVIADGGARNGQAQSGTVNLGRYSVVILSQ